jgi:hypothetical protein
MIDDAMISGSGHGDDEALLRTLLARLAEGAPLLSELAQEMGLTLPELGEWAARPGNQAAILALTRLSDWRGQMIVSRFRAEAAIRLVQLATGSEANDETVRKACVDVLRAQVPSLREPGRGSRDALLHAGLQLAATPSERTILEALERLGQMDADGEREDDEPTAG